MVLNSSDIVEMISNRLSDMPIEFDEENEDLEYLARILDDICLVPIGLLRRIRIELENVGGQESLLSDLAAVG
jgi:hypothetical protein